MTLSRVCMPATSPGCARRTCVEPRRSQNLRYMRSSIAAQSCASVPPEPAWMSMKQLFGSSGLENMRRNSIAAMSFSSRGHRALHRRAWRRRPRRGQGRRAPRRRRGRSPRESGCRPRLRAFFSLPSSCARCGSLQTLASLRRVDFRQPFCFEVKDTSGSADRACRSASREAI